jgi:glucose-1-phosphate cytidylyltransferase
VKVVLFCGGLGMRLRDYSDRIPKPMVPIGQRPVLWHVMKYYAAFGHTDFILCLGYKGDVVKEYFLNYQEWLSNDVVLSHGGMQVDLENRDIADWRITFVDTGLHATIGERLLAVREHLDGDDVFLANYSDGLTDLHLPDMIEHFYARDVVGSFLCVPPSASFHLVDLAPDGTVQGLVEAAHSRIVVNGGYFVLRREIFDVLHAGEELVVEPFERLIEQRRLAGYPYYGFWRGMDTFKDRQHLEELHEHDRGVWQVWKHGHQPVRLQTLTG